MVNLSPNFQRAYNQARPLDKDVFRNFFEKVSPAQIEQYAKGGNLSELVDLAIKVEQTARKLWGNRHSSIQARQYHLNLISETKQRLNGAIVLKRDYYNHHWLGKITKFFLKLFGMWNNGYTQAIVKAEDFMLYWDLRRPLVRQMSGGYYRERTCFLPVNYETDLDVQMTPLWVMANLDTENFYNYDTERELVIEPIVYRT